MGRGDVQDQVLPQDRGAAEALADRELRVKEQLAAHGVGLVPEPLDGVPAQDDEPSTVNVSMSL